VAICCRHVISMTSRIFLAPHHSTEDLERRYKAADGGIERSHLQIIWLLSQGHAAKFVAEVTGYSSVWVSKILWRYNDHGLAGLGDGRLDNPGAAPLLDPAQLEELRAVVSAPPPDGGLWSGRKVDHRAEHRIAAARGRVPASSGLDAAGAPARQSQGEPVRTGAV
jgi:transposase